MPEADLAAQVENDDREVRCDLEVPGTKTLFHAVDSESGQPIPAATLSIFDDWNPVEKTTDAGGQATVAGLRPVFSGDGQSGRLRRRLQRGSRRYLDVQPFTTRWTPRATGARFDPDAELFAGGLVELIDTTGELANHPASLRRRSCRVSEALDSASR